MDPSLQMPTWWSLVLDALLLLPFAFALILMLVMGYGSRTSFRFVRKQSDYLDHQRAVSERALEQNKTFEDIIRQQNAETSRRDALALAHLDEALRLHKASLAQLEAMNAALARIAARLEVPGAGSRG